MLRLPTEEDEVPPLVIPEYFEDRKKAPEKLSEDERVLASEAEEQGLVARRRRRRLKKEEIFDETFAQKEELSPKFVRGLIGSVVLCGAFIIAVLLWPSGKDDKGDGSLVSIPMPVDEAPTEEEKEALAAERSMVSAPFVERTLQPVFEAFLNADSMEELTKWVRHPELSLPRIKEFYGDDYFPDGFSSIIWSSHPKRTGNSIRVTIQDGHYARRDIYLVDDDGWKVDWESWVGWSEISWEDLKASRPTEPVVLRAVVSDVSYYNFSFIDESRWSSYRLESADKEFSLYAYVPRAGVLDAQLKSLEGIKERMFTVKVRYPEGAPTESQVIVDEIVSDGWLLSDDES
ncbi:hypothetical protein ACFQY0_17450 [Haloferula chungangensis]|uniref:Uncharacterized protein n=1 Tax=Haloferula chungangensis TaxID=1048331 RepID=A0ABW2LDD4_9BACT